MAEQKLTYNAEMFKDTFENEFTYMNGFLRNAHRLQKTEPLPVLKGN